MAKRKVVLTGAAGYLSGRMLQVFRERYELVLLDVQSKNRDGEEVDGVVVTDLLSRDRDAYREYFRGADAVVHCAFIRTDRSDVDGYFSAEVGNVTMAYNVYYVCVEEGVRRAVIFSSNHAADFYERLIWTDRMEFVTPDMRPLSDNLYGWAKASYEHLGFAFATGRVSGDRKLENVQLRIGAPREIVIDEGDSPPNLKKLHRRLGAYLSVRDQRQLVIKSIETENIEDEQGVPFQIFYGISGNTHRFWSLANARKVIGYAPEDDSQILFAEVLAKSIEAAGENPG